MRPTDLSSPTVAQELSASRGAAIDTAWVNHIRYSLELSGTTFQFGDSIETTYRVENHDTVARYFGFNSVCQDWVFVFPEGCAPLVPECGTALWTANTLCPCCLTSSFWLPPGGSKTYRRVWKQHHTDGYRLRPGSFTLSASLSSPYFQQSLLSVDLDLVPYGPELIQTALDAASVGDTVLVAPGTYFENLVLGPSEAGVTLRSSSGAANTIIDGGGRGSVIYANEAPASVTIDGFTLQNGREEICEFVSWPRGGGITALHSSKLRIENSIIRDCRSRHGGGMAIALNSVPAVEGNRFLDNVATEEGGAVYLGIGFVGEGSLRNNTFARNVAARGSAIFQDSHTPAFRIERSAFYANVAGSGGSALECGEAVTECNAFWNNDPSPMSGCEDPSAILADPLFCAPEQDDFSLRSDSPLAPAHSGACGLVGALDVGCPPASDVGETAPVAASWMRPAQNPCRHLNVEWTETGRRGLALASAQGLPVELVVIDPQGRRVCSLQVEPTRSRPNREEIRDFHRLPSGVYFLALLAAGQVLERRPIVRVE